MFTEKQICKFICEKYNCPYENAVFFYITCSENKILSFEHEMLINKIKKRKKFQMKLIRIIRYLICIIVILITFIIIKIY